MSTEYSGSSASYPATVTLPSDGDADAALSVNDGLSDLADRTEYHKARMLNALDGGTYTPTAPIDLKGDGGGAGHAMAFDYEPKLNSTIVWRVQPLIPLQGDTGSNFGEIPTDWYWHNNKAWIQKTAGALIEFPLTNIPDNAQIQAIRVLVSGAASGAGHVALPATQALFTWSWTDHSTSPVSPVNSVPFTSQDNAADVAAFNAVHYMPDLTGFLNNVPNDQANDPVSHYLKVQGASGANFESGKFGILGIVIKCACLRLGAG